MKPANQARPYPYGCIVVRQWCWPAKRQPVFWQIQSVSPTASRPRFIGLPTVNSCPREQHWHCLIRILQYVQGTEALSVVLGGLEVPPLSQVCKNVKSYFGCYEKTGPRNHQLREH